MQSNGKTFKAIDFFENSSYNNNTVMVSDDFNGMNFIIGDTLSSLAYNDDLLKYISKCFKEVYFFFTHRVS